MNDMPEINSMSEPDYDYLFFYQSVDAVCALQSANPEKVILLLDERSSRDLRLWNFNRENEHHRHTGNIVKFNGGG